MAVAWRDVVQKPGTENHPMQMDGMHPNDKDHSGMVYVKTDVVGGLRQSGGAFRVKAPLQMVAFDE
ncbi:MAG TPA: hypothetical protein VJS67_11035 [Pseudonocardiaceae bacterium]|nr:hypothetical protein [Pseudonocardiaceae bacterium]